MRPAEDTSAAILATEAADERQRFDGWWDLDGHRDPDASDRASAALDEAGDR